MCGGGEVVVEGFLVAKGGCLFLLMCFSQSAHPFLLRCSALSKMNLRPKLLFLHTTLLFVFFLM